MEIKVIVGDITKIKTGAIIVNFFEGMKRPAGDIATIDKALDGAISQLISQGEIKGKLNEITFIHSLSKLPAARVVIAGIKGGDTNRLNFMFENTYGKLTERKEIVLPKPTIIERLDGSQMLLGAEIVDAESEDNDA